MANIQSASDMELQAQSAMPTPVMEYVNKYTDEAVRNGLAPKPPPPITDSYQMFGQTCHQDDVIIRPLETQGIKRLHPEDYVKKEELKKLTLSILGNFLDLLDILVKCGLSPRRDEKIEDLNLLFIHMHHLINEFRPHQARETLKVMMKMQKKKLSEAGDRLSTHMDKAYEILKQCSEEINTLISKQKQGGDSGDQLMEVDSCYYSSGFLSFPSTEPNDSVPMSIYGSSSQDKDSLLCGLLDIDDKES